MKRSPAKSLLPHLLIENDGCWKVMSRHTEHVAEHVRVMLLSSVTGSGPAEAGAR